MKNMLFCSDCLTGMREQLPDNSIDAIVTDPPYGLAFMNSKWDYDVPGVDIWREALRVLKPGGHLLAFFGTRTYHRGVVNIEDAGFEIRDQIGWIYSSGMPKALDVSKAIDKEFGQEREIISEGKPIKRMIPGADQNKTGSWIKDNGRTYVPTVTAPATPEAQQWEGWKSSLKPAWESIVLARKPLSEKTVAANVLVWGTGAINVDGCRVPAKPGDEYDIRHYTNEDCFQNKGPKKSQFQVKPQPAGGRYPANIIHDGSEKVLAAFPEAPGAMSDVKGTERAKKTKNCYEEYQRTIPHEKRGDVGSASRFFKECKISEKDYQNRIMYCAKASRSERGEGNTHPTVKPLALMRYLCRLITPPGGIVLDPFAGSGTTLLAARIEGFDFCGFEMNQEYYEIALSRISAERDQGRLFA